jgi:hypothetical protein
MEKKAISNKAKKTLEETLTQFNELEIDDSRMFLDDNLIYSFPNSDLSQSSRYENRVRRSKD